LEATDESSQVFRQTGKKGVIVKKEEKWDGSARNSALMSGVQKIKKATQQKITLGKWESSNADQQGSRGHFKKGPDKERRNAKLSSEENGLKCSQRTPARWKGRHQGK